MITLITSLIKQNRSADWHPSLPPIKTQQLLPIIRRHRRPLMPVEEPGTAGPVEAKAAILPQVSPLNAAPEEPALQAAPPEPPLQTAREKIPATQSADSPASGNAGTGEATQLTFDFLPNPAKEPGLACRQPEQTAGLGRIQLAAKAAEACRSQKPGAESDGLESPEEGASRTPSSRVPLRDCRVQARRDLKDLGYTLAEAQKIGANRSILRDWALVQRFGRENLLERSPPTLEG